MLKIKKALSLIEAYNGSNPYLINLKTKLKDKNYTLIQSQVDYICSFSSLEPKPINRVISITEYLGNSLKEKYNLPFVPQKIYIEDILADKDKSLHVTGKITQNQKAFIFWLPKTQLLDPLHEEILPEVDFDKYHMRPPMEHQKLAIKKLMANDRFILADEAGLGKAQPLNSLIATPNGWKRMKYIKIYDDIFDSDGNVVQVTGIFPQGEQMTYQIEFSDGTLSECNLEHLWFVRDSNRRLRNKGWVIKSLKEILDLGLTYSAYSALKRNRKPTLKWEIPLTKPCQYSHKNFLIHPYILGALIGDGCIGGKTISISIPDTQQQIKTKIESLLPNEFKLRANRYPACPQYFLTRNHSIGKNPIKAEIQNLKLNVKSGQKFIPKIYLYGDIEQRIALLRGLMDTDGSCNKNRVAFHTTSLQLAHDIIELVQSLGGVGKLKTYKQNNKSIEYRVNVKSPIQPFELESKKSQWGIPKHNKITRYIKNITKIGVKKQQCISVNSFNKSYLTNNYTVTHNTLSSIVAALELNLKKILVISTATLKTNWKREIRYFSDDIFIADSRNWNPKRFTIINYDILDSFHNIKNHEASRILKENFDLLILDECFTYETLVKTNIGDLPIGKIVEENLTNLLILSYNLKKQKLEYKPLNRLIKTESHSKLQIKLEDGIFINCTKNHKIYVKDKGYVKAEEISEGDYLFVLQSKKINNKKRKSLSEILFQNMRKLSEKKNSSQNKLSTMHNVICSKIILKTKILFSKMCCYLGGQDSKSKPGKEKNALYEVIRNSKNKYETNSSRESSVSQKYFKTNETSKPDVQFKYCEQNEGLKKRNNFFKSWGEWENNNSSNKIIRRITKIRQKLENRISYYHKFNKRKNEIVAKLLQSRYWESIKKNCNRGGWEYSQTKKMEVLGCQKNQSLKPIRVESISILESRSISQYGKCHNKNIVYNLEIADNHNYFANNILVSNCHKISNRTQRSKLIIDIGKYVKKIWFLTGTPISNRPISYYNMLHLCGCPAASNRKYYILRYCNGRQFTITTKQGRRMKIFDERGASNIEELYRITQPYILRRKIKDTLDLPNKLVTPIYLESDNMMCEYDVLLKEYVGWAQSVGKDVSAGAHLVKLSLLRKFLAGKKINTTIDLIENLLEQDKKVVVFTNFTSVLERIYEKFKKIAVKLHGSSTDSERQEAIDRFQSSDKIRVFVGNIKAAGVGITLTKGDVVIFNDLGWNPSDHEQGENRVLRIGQIREVIIYYLLYENTIDISIYNLLSKKKAISDYILSGKIENAMMEDFISSILTTLKK